MWGRGVRFIGLRQIWAFLLKMMVVGGAVMLVVWMAMLVDGDANARSGGSRGGNDGRMWKGGGFELKHQKLEGVECGSDSCKARLFRIIS